MKIKVQFAKLVWFLKKRFRRSPRPYPCMDANHRWRSIAQPYVKQCRVCGEVRYQDDPNGGFPEGLTEYMEAMQAGDWKRLPHTEQKGERAPWLEPGKN